MAIKFKVEVEVTDEQIAQFAEDKCISIEEAEEGLMQLAVEMSTGTGIISVADNLDLFNF